MQVEFFHDVLCAWCYAFSPRLRRLVNEFPQVEIINRCFALAPAPDSIELMFGSRSLGKAEIMRHWRAANENDEQHRICADEMACKPFEYPYSMPGLLACKAAELQGGQKAHWDIFDRIQYAHLTEVLNIADEEVLTKCAKDIGLKKNQFIFDYKSDKVQKTVEKDIILANEYGVYAVPSLVIDRDRIISGAVDYDRLVNVLIK